ncbi:hypothetical protein [Pseudonocardia alaniniphila]|uniref:Uncharacterized protein n=1 Tax=Pseudonocardia alaniniphila TaxID=75291 RepID=A0ABS9TJI4_9PSEU|nr:hypothetical protein [Pseudonocardia alaniniphila]MCH6168677.1 hypothetical protein [Pseudonocardia alaniniphila]
MDVPEVLVEYLDGWSPGEGELARAGDRRLSSMEEIEAFMVQLLHGRYA